MTKLFKVFNSILAMSLVVSFSYVYAEETPSPEPSETPIETQASPEVLEIPEAPEVEVTPLRFERISFDAAYQWSAVEEATPVDIIAELDVKAFDKDNNEVAVYVKDEGGLDLTTPGTYTITIGAVNPENNEEETTTFELTINGEELATPLTSTCDATNTCVVTDWDEFIDSILEANANAPTPYTIVIDGGTTIQADTTRHDAYVGASLFGITGANVTFKGTGTLKGIHDTTGIPENGLMEINNGGTVTIDGITITDHYAANDNGMSSPVSNGQAITIDSGPNISTLNLVSGTIQDCKGDGPGGAIESSGDAIVNMYDGFSILNNESGIINQQGTGPAVNLYVEDGAGPVVFNMYGGLIQGNKSTGIGVTGNCGAVRIGSGTFNMYGGEISNNTAQTSFGAVAIQNSVCNLYGGTITNNKALSGNTGAIYVLGNSSFLLDGTTISNNTANTYAGAIRLSGTANAIIKSGTITGNTATTYGGGIYASNAQLTINGGTITDNTATTYGGGIIADNTQLTVNGGSIDNNNAGTSGGGVSVLSGGTMNLNGGTIESNNATTNGGGVDVGANSIVNVAGGTIKNNTATVDGGGINNATDGTINMSKGTIESNTATNNGSGVNIATGSTMNMTGGTIKNNDHAAVNGDGIMMSGTLNLSGSAVVDPSNDVYLDGTDHMVNVVGAFSGATTTNPIQLTPSDTTMSTSTTVHGNQVVNYYSTDAAAQADVNKLFVPSYETTGLKIIQDDVTGEPTNYLILGTRSILEFVTNGGSYVPSIGIGDGEALLTNSKYNYASTLSTRPGYRIVGWYEDPALTTLVSASTLMVGPLMKVYAKWEKLPDPQFLVTYLDCYGNTVKIEWVDYKGTSSAPNSNFTSAVNVTEHMQIVQNGCGVSTGYKVPNTADKK